MDVGIVGLGIVGSACRYGFEKLGHSVSVHDIKLSTTIQDVSSTEICFVCVPTPSKESGECDVSIVEEVVRSIREHNRDNIIAIKSTVVPGTTISLIDRLDDRICFVPEFLRERCAITDFTENHDLCVIGTENPTVYDKVKQCHGTYPNRFVLLDPTEAEIVKYFSNVYNASLVILANSFYEVCERCGASYSAVKSALASRDHIIDQYLDCNDNFRGFGGMCLPKDTKALAALCKDLDIDVDYFQMLLDENNKYKTTVFDGMRKQ